MAIQITSLVITRKTLLYWSCIGSDSPLVRNANAYEGTIFGDFLTIKTATGAIIYEDVPYNVVKYYDDLNSANNLLNPASAEALQIHLLNQGFYQSSNGGGSGATTFFGGLSDTPASATGRNGQILYVNNGVVDSMPIPEGLDQDNMVVRKYFKISTPTITMEDALEAINNIVTYEVTDKQIILFVSRYFGYSPNDDVLVPVYTILRLNKGKGIYGQNGIQLTSSDLKLINIEGQLNIEDAIDDPTTDIINYFDIVSPQTVSDFLNDAAIPYEIQPQQDGYTIFQGTVDGEPVTYLWVGESGTYGDGFLQSTMADFTILEQGGIIQPVTGVESVTGDLVDDTNPLNPVINERKDVPKDFYIGTNPVGTTLCYITDTVRYYQLPSVINGVNIPSTNEIVRNPEQPNDFFLAGRFGSDTDLSIGILLKGGYVQDNLLYFTEITATQLPISKVHGTAFHRGYVYCASRYDDRATYGQKFIKVNPYNFDAPIIEKQLPTTGVFAGNVTDIIPYKNYIYTFITNGGTAQDYFIRLDENLQNEEVVFERPDNTTLARLNPNPPFVISNDEVIVVTVRNQIGYENQIGVSVYSMTGTLKRSAVGLIIGTSNPTLPTPHWIAVRNGKIFVTCSRIIDGETKFLARISLGSGTLNSSIVLEEYLTLQNAITDDNSITEDDYLLLNEECYDGDASIDARLIKINCYDFTDFEVVISNYNGGYGCHGSLNYREYVESYVDRLSQLKNDIGAGTAQNLQQVTAVGAVTNIPLRVKDVTTAEETSYNDNGHSYKDASGNVVVVEHNSPIVPAVKYAIPAKSTNDTFAMLSDVGSAFEPYDTFSDFPPTGVEGILYLDEESLKLYVWDDVNDVYVVVNPTDLSGYVPYQGATEPLNLGEQPLYFYKADGLVTTNVDLDALGFVINKFTFTGDEFDYDNIESKIESIQDGFVSIGHSKTTNGENTQASLKLDIVDFNRPTIQTNFEGLEFDIPVDKELKYTNTPLIDSPLSIPTKEYVDNVAGGGTTNLSYTASPTDGVVLSDTGTDATITAATTTNAGLLLPAEKVKLNATSGTNTGDNAVNTNSNAYTDTVAAKRVLSLYSDDVDSATLTGTTAETVLKSYKIAANTLTRGVLEPSAFFEKTGGAGGFNLKMHSNTVNNLTGSPQLFASITPAANNSSIMLERDLWIKDGNVGVSFPLGSTNNVPLASSNAPTQITFDPTVDNYILITGQLNNAADSLKVRGATIDYKRRLL